MLDVDPSQRRHYDFYPTPTFQTLALLNRLPSMDDLRIIEPCAGDGAISSELCGDVITNDMFVRPPLAPHFTLDARRRESWNAFAQNGPIDVAITNPPFNEAFAIAQAGYDAVSMALILLLRITWCEPVEDRGPWLWEHPPTSMIVMPRYSYRKNGSGDSATSCWFIWAKHERFRGLPPMDFLTWDERDRLIAQVERRRLTA